jgi:hypothetical protein
LFERKTDGQSYLSPPPNKCRNILFKFFKDHFIASTPEKVGPATLLQSLSKQTKNRGHPGPPANEELRSSYLTSALGAGLPDCMFSLQKFQFGYILEGLGMVNFIANLDILGPFGRFKYYFHFILQS